MHLIGSQFYISYKVQVEHSHMACKSGFLVESKVPCLANLYRRDLLKDLGQFTEFWSRLRTRCQTARDRAQNYTPAPSGVGSGVTVAVLAADTAPGATGGQMSLP